MPLIKINVMNNLSIHVMVVGLYHEIYLYVSIENYHFDRQLGSKSMISQ